MNIVEIVTRLEKWCKAKEGRVYSIMNVNITGECNYSIFIHVNNSVILVDENASILELF